MEEYTFDITWLEEHSGNYTVKAENRDEARDKVIDAIYLESAIGELIESGAEKFNEIKYDSVKFELMESDNYEKI